ncbi:peptidoglycan DD-metalloendopeptidase family protein [Neisseria meningitidis]|uniref:M23 family metallopeptidase n=17 Tax=Neisseria meningitidis TaxID=487 RepID=UPI000E596ABB|nr:M23 family metallopeptidase [Neisseria meningitidis]MBH2011721.1 peptidoglycan DD-metalloendopeptidase family protein [Neisseria meningitidis]MBH2013596.1 peptidoglycan DD-metalloendopeptidase family protein [Neisseria meningitidis]MBH2025846.1 peptidoglycan DD-metalloendopeptidase family protein [Neisseria meningitidis]MBH2027487.1 peptidoglycan DD-metalloendopeptidase family protein [Neisseria meningitidis]MBH2039062.1 peptidoglycan DD-metalloendopeptidase family protein [Neisseria mening
MLKQTTLLAACASFAALLGGCATQQPAPVIAGNSGMQDAPSSAVYNNPYGATPYNAAPAANDAPYVPPVQSAPVYTPPAYVPPSAPAVSGTYVPSYAPVDINAATHTIVRGDTVYNISKRYHISQDDFRAWNGMTDNTLSIGQIVKVKPAGYAAPKAAAVKSRPAVPAAAQPPVQSAPVDINAATHTIVRGDTVYNISKRYHISQDDFRAWNGMTDNMLSIGQIVKVKPAGYAAPKTSAVESRPAVPAAVQTPVKPAEQPPVQSAPQPAAPAAENKAVPAPAPQSPAASPSGTRSVGGIVWQRPTQGKVVADFGGNNKGVDIAGNAGQPVLAAADGKVVYAGSGLRGYGNLVIIQHNSSFLTAYGHNQKLLVGEGQQVKRGQQVALMGNTDASRTQLHFEVRQNGKPVNPNSYIAF